MSFEKILDTDILSDADYKQYRYDEIDARTGELILEGFVYATKTFSFSENAQRNLIGAYAGRTAMTYPVGWNVKDDSETYQIADATEMETFFLTALASKKSHQDSGTTIKTSIRDAATRAAMEAIIDNR